MKTANKKTNRLRPARRNTSNGNGRVAFAKGNGNGRPDPVRANSHGASASFGDRTRADVQTVIQVKRSSAKGCLGVGIIGCGYWGPNLVRNLNALGDCHVRWLCDLKLQRLQHLNSLYPSIQTTNDFRRLLTDKQVQAVVIATPVSTHFALAKASLAAGKHVFVEKPLARSSAECAELIELARKKGLVLMVGHTFLYSSPVRKIKEIIDRGDIGQVRYINARRLNLGLFQKDINVTWDLAPHDISIVLYLLGQSPRSVNCRGHANVTPGVEDVTNMCLNFEGSCFASIQSSWLDPLKVREMTIVGDRRMILYNDVAPLEKIKIFDARVETPPHYDTFAEFHYAYHYGDMYVPYLKQEEPLKVECQHFMDCIRNEEHPLSSGEDGRKMVQVLEAASLSLKRGGAEVSIDQLEQVLQPVPA